VVIDNFTLVLGEMAFTAEGEQTSCCIHIKFWSVVVVLPIMLMVKGSMFFTADKNVTKSSHYHSVTQCTTMHGVLKKLALKAIVLN